MSRKGYSAKLKKKAKQKIMPENLCEEVKKKKNEKEKRNLAK